MSQNKAQNGEVDPEIIRNFQHPQTALSNVSDSSPAPTQPAKTLINFNTDIIGLFQTVSAVPTQVPNSPYQQVQIYTNSTTYRLYWYDNLNKTWHYVTATA